MRQRKQLSFTAKEGPEQYTVILRFGSERPVYVWERWAPDQINTPQVRSDAWNIVSGNIQAEFALYPQIMQSYESCDK